MAISQVQLGQRRADFTVISGGVKTGENVVTAGQLGLADGKKVSPVPYQPPPPLPGRASSPSPTPEPAK